ncbi:unnamed protein product [Closterium sp. NIES-54]
MAAQELRWLTYLLTNLGEKPRSPPMLYVDNKAMIALCQEHRVEHRTKHITLRYFLARELQQRGQLRLAYVATRANTADIFTKALPPAVLTRQLSAKQLFAQIAKMEAEMRAAIERSRLENEQLRNELQRVTQLLSTMNIPTSATSQQPQRQFECDSKDGLSLFDLTSGASTAPAADADSTVRSQWLTRDAAARLAVRSHLPSTERAHFSHYKSAKTLYDAVVARYSSPATVALSHLMLPYLFRDLAAFATVTDLITHLRTSDTRYHAVLPAEFCAQNPPPHVHHPLLPSHVTP